MSLTKVSYSMINGTPINAVDYGAANNTDSTAAINLALAAGSDVYLPAGTFLISGPLNLGGKRLFGEGVKTVLMLTADVSLVDTHAGFNLLNLAILINVGYSQTATLIKLDANTGFAYQANNIDLSGTTILANSANCTAIHFKCTNGSYMSYNNMSGIAVVNEGTLGPCILFEVDNSGSFIQGNSFNNLNLINGGIHYIYNGTANDSTLMIGNYFDGTYQTGLGYTFQLSGINNTPLWDSAGKGNTQFHKESIGVHWGSTFHELVGPDKWGSLQPTIFVHDGWGRRVEKYDVLATGVTLANLSGLSKAQRGVVRVSDPCVNVFDPRFVLTGMDQQGEIVSVSDSRRSAIEITNTAVNADPAQVILPYSACTISKLPEFKIGFRKRINGYYGSGTPLAWNPRLDAKIGLISDDLQNGVYAKLTGIVGSTDGSTIALCYMVGGVETVLDSSLNLSEQQHCYLTIYTDDTNVYIKATTVIYTAVAGVLIAEDASIGLTTGFKSVARASLFDVDTVTLNPQFTLTSTDKEAGRAIYDIYGIEFTCGEM